MGPFPLIFTVMQPWLPGQAEPAPSNQAQQPGGTETGDTESRLPYSYRMRPEVGEESQFKHWQTQVSLNSYQWAALRQSKQELEREQKEVLVHCTPSHRGGSAHPFLVSCSL